MAKTSEELQAELEKEINQQIKTAEFHAGFKARFEIAQRLVEDGKLSLEEIADVTMVPVRFVKGWRRNSVFLSFAEKNLAKATRLKLNGRSPKIHVATMHVR